MKQAVWNGAVLAESNQTIVVEGNHYFPAEDVKWAYFAHSDLHSVCAWKGSASYYHVRVDGDIAQDAAWYYANPKPDAQLVKGRIAFWSGVEIRDA